MIDQLLELELGLIKARLDARKVLPKKSGKRPGKFCKGKGKGSYIAAEKRCADHETTTPDGKRKLSESGKRSAEELAKKVRERKGMEAKKTGTAKAQKKMPEEEFHSTFKKTYQDIRRAQELRGAVAIQVRQVADEMMQEHGVSQKDVDGYIRSLKKGAHKGAFFVTEGGKEFIEF
jgi:UDP-N-acetylmuramoylalanine-D-glutamate ligase